MGQKQKKEKTEEATRLAWQNKREQIEKWNQMTALRFQTGGRHQKCLASHRGSKLIMSTRVVKQNYPSSLLPICLSS